MISLRKMGILILLKKYSVQKCQLKSVDSVGELFHTFKQLFALSKTPIQGKMWCSCLFKSRQLNFLGDPGVTRRGSICHPFGVLEG